MKNQIRDKIGAWSERRCLRFEILEFRLPFAVAPIPADAESWLFPATESPLIFQEPWRSSPFTFDHDPQGSSVAFEALPVELAFSIPEQLVEPVPFFGDDTADSIAILSHPMAVLGTTHPTTDDVFSTPIGIGNGSELLSSSPDAVPANLLNAWLDEALLFDDVILSDDWLFPTNAPQTMLSPLEAGVLEGLALPVWMFYFADFAWDAGDVRATIALEVNIEEGYLFTEQPRSEYSIWVSIHPLFTNIPSSSTNLDGSLLGGMASFYTSSDRELLIKPLQVHQEKNWKIDARAKAPSTEGFCATHRSGQFCQHYQTLGELLQQNGIEFATDSQLPIEKGLSKSARRPRNHPYDDGTRVEIAHASVKFPNNTVPEGMLAIGCEVGIQVYRRVRSFGPNESFVAQSEFICDDLRTIAIPMDETMENPSQESSSFNLPESFQWVAIGATILLTHASLLARKSREFSIVHWRVVKLPKFMKHDPNESLLTVVRRALCLVVLLKKR